MEETEREGEREGEKEEERKGGRERETVSIFIKFIDLVEENGITQSYTM